LSLPGGIVDIVARAVEKIHAAINQALENPDVQRQLAVADIPGKPMTLGDLAKLMKTDHEKFVRVEGRGGAAAVTRYCRRAQARSPLISSWPALIRPSIAQNSCFSMDARVKPGHDQMTTFGTHLVTLLASILIDVSSIFVVNAVCTSNGFSMPR
jgi:hypothetical protein